MQNIIGDNRMSIYNYPVIGSPGPTGPAGSVGPAGPTGLQGSASTVTGPTGAILGMPAGGPTGAVLSKVTGADYDFNWRHLDAAYDLCFDFLNDVIPNDARVSIVVGRNTTIPANFNGSIYSNLVNATLPQLFDILHNSGAGDSSIGNVNVSIDGTGVFSSHTPGSNIAVTAGDRISVIAPASADSTLSGAFFTIITNRI